MLGLIRGSLRRDVDLSISPPPYKTSKKGFLHAILRKNFNKVPGFRLSFIWVVATIMMWSEENPKTGAIPMIFEYAGEIHSYAPFTEIYCNESFDHMQSLAYKLTALDRQAGRPAPPAGYSAEAFAAAEKVVRAASAYHVPWQPVEAFPNI
jgi:hypothetical protein